MLMWMGGVPGLARKSPLRCVMLTKVESAIASYTCCCNKKSSVLTLLSTSLLISLLTSLYHHHHAISTFKIIVDLKYMSNSLREVILNFMK